MSGERCPDGGLHTPNWQDGAWVCLDCGVALVVADEAAHDDRIRAEALAPVLALAEDYQHRSEGDAWMWMPIYREVYRAVAFALRAAAGTPTHHPPAWGFGLLRSASGEADPMITGGLDPDVEVIAEPGTPTRDTTEEEGKA